MLQGGHAQHGTVTVGGWRVSEIYIVLKHPKCREISWDLVRHFEWRHMVTALWIEIIIARKNMSYSAVSTEPSGGVSILRCPLTSIGIPMLKKRRYRDRLISNMWIPYLGKTVFILKRGHDGLAPLYARTSASIMVTISELRICTGPEGRYCSLALIHRYIDRAIFQTTFPDALSRLKIIVCSFTGVKLKNCCNASAGLRV